MANDGLFDVRTMAKLLMLDERRIQQLVKEGWIEQGERGRYSLVATVQGYIKYLKEHTRETSRGSEHARLARAQAQKVEMENYRRMGELGSWAQIDETMQSLVAMMRSSLESIPGRLASELASIAEPPRIYKRLQEEHRGILTLCANHLEKRAATLEAMPDPSQTDAAEGTDGSGVLGERQSSDAGGQSGAGSLPST